MSEIYKPDKKSETIQNKAIEKIPSYHDLPNEENLPEFDKLRKKIHGEMEVKLKKRIETDPIMTEEEEMIDCYKEQIEPQCRDAIFKMRRKGYRTGSSGFGVGNMQVVDGNFKEIDLKIAKFLINKGYFVYTVGADTGQPTSISFRPKNPNINEITNQWNELADLLPDLGHEAEALSRNRYH